MRSNLTLRACAVLLLFTVAIAPFGCRDRDAVRQPAVDPAETSASVAATGSADASSAAAATVQGSTLSTTEARALDAELSAIQSELDKLSLPGDGDFNDIESGLQ